MHQRKEKQSVIKLLWSENVGGSETYGRVTVYYNSKPVSQKKVYEWVENSITIGDNG
jgi:hypothetical protein